MGRNGLLRRLVAAGTVGLALIASAAPASAEASAPPTLPSGLTASGGPDGIAVQWKVNGASGLELAATATDEEGGSYHCRAALDEGSCLIGVPGGNRYQVSASVTDPTTGQRSAEEDIGKVATPIVDPPPVDPPTGPLPIISGLAVEGGADSSATVTWDPIDDPGLFLVIWATDDSEAVASACWVPVADGRCEVADLVNETSYRFFSSITDGWSFSDPVLVGEATPLAALGAEPPSAPTEVLALQAYPYRYGYPSEVQRSQPRPYHHPGQPGIEVRWKAPASNGGAPVQRYEVTVVDSASGELAGTCTSPRWSEGCQVDGLAEGRTYEVSVVAVNSAGESPAGVAEPVTLGPPPEPPALGDPELVELDDGSYLVRWTVEDAKAYPGLSFIVSSEQGAYCFAAYEPGSGQASCILSTEDGSEPTGVVVEIDGPCYTFGGPVERGGTGKVLDDPSSPSAPPAPSGPSRAGSPSSSEPAGGQAAPGPVPGTTAPAEQVNAGEPRGDVPRSITPQLAVARSAVDAGPGGAVAVSVLLILLAMATPLLRRRS